MLAESDAQFEHTNSAFSSHRRGKTVRNNLTIRPIFELIGENSTSTNNSTKGRHRTFNHLAPVAPFLPTMNNRHPKFGKVEKQTQKNLYFPAFIFHYFIRNVALSGGI